MEVWTERIASLSLTDIVVFLATGTAARLALRRSRVAVFRFLSEILEVFLLAAGLLFLVLRPFVLYSYHIPTASMRPTLREGDRILVNKLFYRLRRPAYGDAVVFRAPPEADAHERQFVKRLIGLPGDTVEVRPGFAQIGNVRFYHPDIRGILGDPVAASERDEDDNLPRLRLTSDRIWYDGKPISREEFGQKLGVPDGTEVKFQPGQVLRNGEQLPEDFIAEDPEYRVGPTRVPEGACFVLGDNRNQSHDSHRWGMLGLERIVGRADIVFWPPRRIRMIQ